MQSIQGVQKFVSTRFLATRRGTIVLGVAAAVLAALVLLVYLNQYRDSVSAGSAPVSVLVARSLIEVGTPGDAVAAQGRTELVQTAEDSVLPNALTDPSSLTGTVTINRVFPGQQLTLADFQAVGVSGVGAQLQKNQRAVAVPVDAENGLVGRLVAGDKVDIYGSFDNVLKLMMQDILVLEPAVADGGGIGGGGSSGNVLVRVTPRQASQLAFAADNGKLWFVLRPRTGARRVVPNTVTLDKLLAQGR
jgi:Flp pilus assembly protein CpaB